ncbi:hypothetical protein REPUB_Repub05bG0189900 [Reevesia pubescens]
MEGFSAEDLSTIGGIATVSLLHSFIPTHWLPFSIVGRAQKWTLSRTLLVTAFGAVLHVISTSLLGITAITMANTIAGEETVHKLASLLLIVLGGSYILLFLSGKGGHSHSHNQPMEKMAVAGLVLVPALSPCATTLPVFLAVGNSSSMMILAIIVLLFSTIAVMTSLVALSFYGASQLKFHWVERYDKVLVGSVLCLVGILTLIFHDHDGDEGRLILTIFFMLRNAECVTGYLYSTRMMSVGSLLFCCQKLLLVLNSLESQSHDGPLNIPAAFRNFTMCQKDNTLDQLVQNKWLCYTEDDNIGVGVRSILDLRSFFHNAVQWQYQPPMEEPVELEDKVTGPTQSQPPTRSTQSQPSLISRRNGQRLSQNGDAETVGCSSQASLPASDLTRVTRSSARLR